MVSSNAEAWSMFGIITAPGRHRQLRLQPITEFGAATTVVYSARRRSTAAPVKPERLLRKVSERAGDGKASGLQVQVFVPGGGGHTIAEIVGCGRTDRQIIGSCPSRLRHKVPRLVSGVKRLHS